MISDIDHAVGLDLSAGLDELCHDLVNVGAVVEGNGQLLCHVIDGRVGHAGGASGGIFHEICAVGAVNFDLVGLFHVVLQNIKFTIKRLLNRCNNSII